MVLGIVDNISCVSQGTLKSIVLNRSAVAVMLCLGCISYPGLAYSACTPDDRNTYINYEINCTGIDTDGWAGTASLTTVIVHPGASIGPIGIANSNPGANPIGGGGNEVYNLGTVSYITVGPDNYVENYGVAAQIVGHAWSTLINEATGLITNGLSDFSGISGYSQVLTEGRYIYYGSDVINRGSITMTGATGTLGMYIERNGLGINESTGTILTTGTDSAGMSGSEAVELRNQGAIEVQGALSDGMFVVGDAIMSNSGTITASGDGGGGIDLIGRAGQITNSGSIIAAGIENYGISALFAPVGTSGEPNLSVTNTGTISTLGFMTYGISVDGYQNALVRNLGSVEVNGIDSQGISVGGAANNIVNANTGTVSANGDGAYAIALGGSGQVTNAGRIVANGANSVGIAAQNLAPGDTITISNTGSILTTLNGAGGIGLIGLGSITNSGNIRVEGDASAGIYSEAGAGNIVPIRNDGEIRTTGADSFGIYQIGSGGTINNNGSIYSDGLLSFAINVEGDDVGVTNSSTGEIVTQEVETVAINVVGDRANITNDGVIETQSSVSPAIAVQGNGCKGTSSTCVVENTSTITTVNAYSPAIAVIGSNHVVSNKGNIKTGGSTAGTGDESYGMVVVGGSNAEIRQQGTNSSVVTAGDRSHGIVMGLEESLQPELVGTMDLSSLAVSWGIETAGAGAFAVNVYGDGNTIELEQGADLVTKGSGSHGVNVKSWGSGLTKITNYGTPLLGARTTTEGNDANGINILSPDNVEILNEVGTLISVGGARSSAINLESTKALITNYGQLVTHGENATENFGIKALFNDVAEKNSRVINNYGEIFVAKPGSRGIDIVGDDVIVKNGDINLRGARITAGADGGFFSAGISSSGKNIEMSNEGLISVSGSYATGMDIIAASTGEYILTNAGTISVNSEGGAGISISSLTGNQVNTNQADISHSACVVDSRDNKADMANCGSIELTQSGAIGMRATNVNNINIDNQLAIAGEALVGGGLYGISVVNGNESFIGNINQITLVGDDSVGISVIGNQNIVFAGQGQVQVPSAPLNNPYVYIDPFGDSLFDQRFLETPISYEFDRLSSRCDNDPKNPYCQPPQSDIFVSGANAIGINIDGSNNVVGLPTYSDKFSTVDATGAGSIGIKLSGSDNLVINGGYVRGETGIQGGAGNDSVLNLGYITGGIQLGGGDDVVVDSSGEITGTVDGGSEALADTLVVFVGPDGFGYRDLSGNQYINFEKFYKTGSGTLRLKDTLVIDHLYELQGEVQLLTGARLQVATATVYIDPGATLSGAGIVDGRVALNGGTIAPGVDGVGTLTFTNNLDMNDGLLRFDAGSLFGSDQLIVDGDVTLSGGMLEVVLDSSYSGGVLDLLLVGGGFSMLDSFGGIYGVAAAGSGIELGTEFTVALGGELFQGLVTSAVPVPPAVWLFGSGLIGLVGVARRKKS